ncbi:MAG: OB-fold domain-containing protein [Firmicutes bacterium]|nr:OB-fold domain-containing protein [Bacillota bacterium]
MDRIYFKEGIFSVDTDTGNGTLLGNKCASCGQIYFPPVDFCFNCLGQVMEEAALSRRGKLYSYTRCHMPASRFQPPFFVGLVDIPEGVRVFAPLKEAADRSFQVGMDMEVKIEELWRENDKQVIGYVFEPVK